MGGRGPPRHARKTAASRRHDDAFDLNAGHALRRIDGEPDGFFGFVEIDHGPGLDPERTLVTDAENAAAVGPAAQHLG